MQLFLWVVMSTFLYKRGKSDITDWLIFRLSPFIIKYLSLLRISSSFMLHGLYGPCRTFASFRIYFHACISLATFLQPLRPVSLLRISNTSSRTTRGPASDNTRTFTVSPMHWREYGTNKRLTTTWLPTYTIFFSLTHPHTQNAFLFRIEDAS